ncbi:MAG: M42 family peptidase [Anaerolineaceae bacterium]|nr:M42 family peptidase [Anaerolineaceae bacterium]
MATQKKTTDSIKFSLGKKELDLLTRLCNAIAVSGDEQEVRQIVLEEVKGLADEVKVDALGNVLATKRGSAEKSVRVMLSAHMDEVGMMIVKDSDDGTYEFRIVGGIDPRQLVGKSVLVGRNQVPGIIGAKAIHMTTPEERKAPIPVDQLRIDVGPGGKLKIGDRAGFATKLTTLGPSIRSKALDDRLGVFNLIQLLRHAPANVDLFLAFTVQEELGLRGAKVAAFSFDPEIGIAMDSTPANDLPAFEGNEENERYNTCLGKGPAIYLMDGATIGDRRLVKWLSESAEQAGIPWQYRQPGTGGTDAGAIHKTRAGVPSVSVSVPQRYLHSAAGMVRTQDVINSFKLIHAALSRLDPSILKS